MDEQLENVTITKVPTSGKHSTDAIDIDYKNFRVRVVRETGNWHPDGKPFTASIRKDRHAYADPSQWRYGLSAWGGSRHEAIRGLVKFAESKTLIFPDDWLDEAFHALRSEW